jgi:cytochrome P450
LSEKGIEDQIKAIMNKQDLEEKTELGHESIFHSLLNSDLPATEKTLPRLVDEGQTLIAAGSFTTAQYLSVTTYYILSTPDVYQTLKAELVKASPNPATVPPFTELE